MDLITALTAAGGASAGGAAADPNFNQTVLLLHGDGTNGAQNNTFLDSSTNNFTITRNGNTTQGTFSPFSLAAGEWSALAVPNGSNSINTGYTGFSGTGDYTCSFWIYLNSYTGGDNNGGDGGFVYICNQGVSHPTYPLTISISKAGKVIVGDSANFGASWYSTFNSAGSYNTANSIGLNSWNYIHVVRSSGTLSIYANGNLQFSTSQSNSSPAPIANLTINNGNGFDGYISNFRFVTAAITDATSPTAPSSTSTSNQVVLTCYGNRFADFNTATSAKTVTPAGSVSVQPFSPFLPTAAYDASVNGGSGYFDGSGDYLSNASSNALDFGTGNFTVEMWVYRTGSDTQQTYLGGTSNLPLFEMDNGLVRWQTTNTRVGAIPLNTWSYIVWVRDGTGSNQCAAWLNGTRVLQETDSTNYTPTSFAVGGRVGGGEPSTGYIGSLRVVKAAQYSTSSTSITVPTAPFTAIANTSLLCNFTNAGIFDNTGKNNLETVGDAQIDTTTKKYGTGSMEFDGTGDWLKLFTTPNITLGSGDFTFEGWIYLNTVSGAQIIFDQRPASNQGVYPVLYMNGAAMTWYINSSAAITSSNLSTSTWYHFAIVRSSGSTKLYIDGTQSGSTYSDTNNYLASRSYIGISAFDETGGLNGYIDDLRITKGVARYTSAFTPPTAAFPDL